MLKCKMYVIGIVGMCLLVGCGNSNIDNRPPEFYYANTNMILKMFLNKKNMIL